MKQWTVGDVMTCQVVAVRSETPYHDVVELLAENRISALPVIDGAGTVLGVVSEADLLRKVEYAGDGTQPRLFEWGTRRAAHQKASAATVAELMTAPAVTIRSGASLAEAAKLMDGKHVKRLPVVDEAGRLDGVVSRSDLLKTYLRSDVDIHDEVLQGVIEHLLRINPLTVTVDVDRGVVSLGGRLERRSSVEELVAVTRAIPGVTQVVDELTWENDDTYVLYPTGL